jgi:hypothetical protein
MGDFADILFRYAPWTIVLPVALAVWQFRGHTPEMRVFFYYLLIAFATHLLSYLLWKLKVNNYPVMHVYTVAEYLVLLWFFQLLLNIFLHRQVFITLMIIFPAFSVINSIFIEPVHSFNSYSRSIEALIFIFLSVCWFVKTVSEEDSRPPGNTAYYYIVSGLLVYFSGSLVLFSFGAYIETFTLRFRVNIWLLHTLLLTILYLLLTAGLWKQKKA